MLSSDQQCRRLGLPAGSFDLFDDDMHSDAELSTIPQRSIQDHNLRLDSKSQKVPYCGAQSVVGLTGFLMDRTQRNLASQPFKSFICCHAEICLACLQEPAISALSADHLDQFCRCPYRRGVRALAILPLLSLSPSLGVTETESHISGSLSSGKFCQKGI